MTHLPPPAGRPGGTTPAERYWLHRLAGRVARGGRDDRRRRLQRQPDRADLCADARGRVPVGLSGGERSRPWRPGLQGLHAPGDGQGRRPRVPRLHLGPGRRAGRLGEARLRPARGRRRDALPVGPRRARSAPHDRVTLACARAFANAGAFGCTEPGSAAPRRPSAPARSPRT